MTHAQRLGTLGGLAAAALWLLIGCSHQQSSASAVHRQHEYTGVVHMFEGGVAIGGEADPTGYVLEGGHPYPRLYLRDNGTLRSDDLAALEGRRVRVSGQMESITVGGVETPQRTFHVLEVTSLRQAGGVREDSPARRRLRSFTDEESVFLPGREDADRLPSGYSDEG